ncbi:MAG: hypothetical protein JO036_03860 [Candidatus Eremiobacteraeota bacterium]|nr:hypothetical protein [Candidatus Eremiobacteraeota bacterium]
MLLADALVRAGRENASTVHALMRRALVFSADRPGLYDGAAGLLVAIDAVDPRRTSLAQARGQLRALLAAAIRNAPPPDAGDPDTYDLLYGVAGCALALRDDEPDALNAFLAYAERLADVVDERMAAPSRYRAVNLGVAHGIPGVLAALNAVCPRPHPLARRYTDAILAMSHEVGGARRWGSLWEPRAVPSARRAWCYQTVGVAAVLYDRAVLDGDDALRALTVRAVDALLHGEKDGLGRFGPSLCHGRAGLATIAWHLAPEGERFVRTARALAEAVLGEYDEHRALGFRSDSADGLERIDFLDGSFGIALFLADAATGGARGWLPLLGLLPD